MSRPMEIGETKRMRIHVPTARTEEKKAGRRRRRSSCSTASLQHMSCRSWRYECCCSLKNRKQKMASLQRCARMRLESIYVGRRWLLLRTAPVAIRYCNRCAVLSWLSWNMRKMRRTTAGRQQSSLFHIYFATRTTMVVRRQLRRAPLVGWSPRHSDQ